MTREKLNQYRALLREQTKLEEKINRLYEQIERLPAVMDKVEASQKDYPYIRIHIPVKAAPPKEVKKLEERIREHEKHKEKIDALLEEIEAYIRSIPDSEDRQIFEMKFLDCKSYREIGEELSMDLSTVAKRIEKQLSKNSKI